VNIFYPDPHPLPGTTPEAIQILSTAHALGQLGAQVTLLTPNPKIKISAYDILGRELSNNVSFIYLRNSAGKSNRVFYKKAITTIKQGKPDAILIRNLKMAYKTLKRNFDNVFFESHELFQKVYLEENPNPSIKRLIKLFLLRRREKFIYTKSKGIIALTSHLLSDIKELYPFIRTSTIAPDGVDLKVAELALKLPQSVRNTKDKHVLYLGSLHQWKGVETLIAAMPMTDSVILNIAGGPQERILELSAQAASLGVIEKIHFHGQIEPKDRFKLINSVDICILPLTSSSIAAKYTSPLKLFEYMAMGKPIIASNLPSITEILTNETNGILINHNDSSALADSIMRLSYDKDLRERLGQAAAAHSKKYSWGSRAATIIKLMSISSHQHAQ